MGDLPAIVAGTVHSGSRGPYSHERELPERELLGTLPKRAELSSPLNPLSSSPHTFSRLWCRTLPPTGYQDMEGRADFQRYQALRTDFPGELSGFWVEATGPQRDRDGEREPLAYLDRRTCERLGVASHAAAWIRQDDGEISALPVRVIATTLSDGREGPVVRLDQMVRDALGIAVGDRCEIAPLRIPRSVKISRWLARVFSPRWLAARVVRSAQLTMERPVAWLDPHLPPALGIDDGGDVVLLSAAPVSSDLHEFELKTIRLQALSTTPPMEAARRAALYPESRARFPDPAEVLGVFPDLPWAWIDAEAKSRLGLRDLHSCSPVLVAPSARYLFARLASRFVLAVLGLGAGLAFVTREVFASDGAAAAVLSAALIAAGAVIYAGRNR